MISIILDALLVVLNGALCVGGLVQNDVMDAAVGGFGIGVWSSLLAFDIGRVYR